MRIIYLEIRSLYWNGALVARSPGKYSVEWSQLLFTPRISTMNWSTDFISHRQSVLQENWWTLVELADNSKQQRSTPSWQKVASAEESHNKSIYQVWIHDIDRLVQGSRISIASPLELRLPCTKLSISYLCDFVVYWCVIGTCGPWKKVGLVITIHYLYLHY